jgi:hypothetical protein
MDFNNKKLLKKESATGMGAGSIASVTSGMGGVIKRDSSGVPKARQRKNRNGTAKNALDSPGSIFGEKAMPQTRKKTNEALSDLASATDLDHEVQMARAELYKLAEYAIKLHNLLKNVSEAEGLEGWVQAKITKAADYISSVYHHLEYQEAEESQSASPMRMPAAEGVDTYKDQLRNRLAERKLTKGEEKKREKNVKGMKKNTADFKKRYGKDAESVMYATATKNAKKD